MTGLDKNGRLPITSQNISIVVEEAGMSFKSIINQNLAEAGLSIIGFHGDNIKHFGEKMFEGYDNLGNVLFVHSCKRKTIE